MESLGKQFLGGDHDQVSLGREDLAYAFAVGQELYGPASKGETFLSLDDLIHDVETGDAGVVV